MLFDNGLVIYYTFIMSLNFTMLHNGGPKLMICTVGYEGDSVLAKETKCKEIENLTVVTATAASFYITTRVPHRLRVWLLLPLRRILLLR